MSNEEKTVDNKALDTVVEQLEKTAENVGDAVKTVENLEKSFADVQATNAQTAKDVVELRSYMEAKHGASGADDFSNEMSKFISSTFKHSRGKALGDDFTTTTDASAGYLVDDILAKELFEIGDVYGNVLPRCTNITIPAGSTMDVNKDALLPTAYWRSAQGTDITGTAPTFGQASLAPILVGSYIKASNELLESPGVGFGSLMTARMARAIVKAKEDAILKGDSVGGDEPTDGLLTVDGVNAQTALSDMDVSDIANFLGEAVADYAPSEDPSDNVILMTAGKYLKLLGLATASGMPAFTWADPSRGQAASIWGYEIIRHPSMNDGTVHNIALGDLKNILVASSNQAYVDFNPYSGWTSNETWMKVQTHCDYEVMMPNQWSKATIDA